MKAFKLIGLALFTILMCLSACSSGGDDPIELTPKPEVPKSEITIDSSIISNGLSFSDAENEQTISFTTNENWTLSVAATTSGGTWCTPSTTNGIKGNVSVKFKVAENTSYDNRSVSVTIKAGTASKTFTISQKGVDALLVTSDKYEVSQEGGSIEIEVKANIDYEMEISETSKEWITESSSRGLATYKHTFKIAANVENEKRKGEIYLVNNDFKIRKEIEIYQEKGNYNAIPYLTFVSNSTQTLTMSQNVDSLEYSVNGYSWSELGTKTVTFGGDKGALRLRGKNLNGTSVTRFGNFSTIKFGNDSKVTCSGDIRTLLDYENYKDVYTGNARFIGLFRNCSSLVTAPELPIITLAESCYRDMFENCCNLRIAPELPAIELAESCYFDMFGGCTNLTTAPELPATKLAESCYYNMFSRCTSLTVTPNLPAIILEKYCYGGMFIDCANLIKALQLPATTLAKECYHGMFGGCKKLTKVPQLPVMTLAESCYGSMFSGCTSLTTAPELPATTLAEYCYSNMFSGCTSLTTAPELPTTTLAKGCYMGMFGICANLTIPPKLPATELAVACYDNMFYNCKNLKEAPILQAKKLEKYCYREMFDNCISLTNITMLATDINADDCLYHWVSNVASLGTFTKAKGMTALPSGRDGIPEGWTIVDKE